jgi:hypothetical protein
MEGCTGWELPASRPGWVRVPNLWLFQQARCILHRPGMHIDSFRQKIRIVGVAEAVGPEPGGAAGPSLYHLLEILGKKTVMERLDATHSI